MYKNEEGQWVTDLAYCTSFEKEVDEKVSQSNGQFQTEDFVSAGMYRVNRNIYCMSMCVVVTEHIVYAVMSLGMVQKTELFRVCTEYRQYYEDHFEPYL